eukprot:CAMPEP_0185453398 /NCGR_PEP_ID=MMETSP1365-20130426/69953_1 /TAXON_ID=38817 /ORGANISM="Gephyrocapsa oceanica, Strain RCC1303" /LENGTH=32 /DNA_ID= /DNA_START= /DNA_END= /DNA_ORIENTATION=
MFEYGFLLPSDALAARLLACSSSLARACCQNR